MVERIKNHANKRMNVLQRLEQSSFWRARTEHERTLLLIACVVILCAMVYSLLIKPALFGRAQLEKDLPLLRQQTAQLQSWAKETATLSNQTPFTITPMTKESLEASLARHGVIAQSVVVSGHVAKVELSSIPFANLLNSLDEMQKTARISVMEANVLASAAVSNGNVNATLTLRQSQLEGR